MGIKNINFLKFIGEYYNSKISINEHFNIQKWLFREHEISIIDLRVLIIANKASIYQALLEIKFSL